VLRSSNRTSHHTCECGNESRNSSNLFLLLAGLPRCPALADFRRKFPRTHHTPENSRADSNSIIWLVSRVTKFAPNGLLISHLTSAIAKGYLFIHFSRRTTPPINSLSALASESFHLYLINEILEYKIESTCVNNIHRIIHSSCALYVPISNFIFLSWV